MKPMLVETKQKISVRTIAPIGIITLGFSMLAAGGFFFWKGIQPPVSVPKTPTMQSLTTELLSLNTQYQQASASGKVKKLRTLRSIAEQRKTLAASLLQKDPGTFLKTSLAQSDRDSLPSEIQPLVEQAVTLQGEIEVEHSDDFQHAVAYYSYSVKTKDPPASFRLHFSGAGPTILSGATVKVSGVQLDNDFAVPGVTTSDEAVLSDPTIDPLPGLTVVAVPSSPAVSGAKKIMVVVYDVADAPMITDPNWWRGKIFTDPDSVNAYYQENSFGNLSVAGKLSTQGDIYGPYRVSGSATHCSSEGLDEAKQRALQDGAVFSGYDYYIYIGWASAIYCGKNGIQIGNEVYSYSGQDFFTIEHELGHAFGTGHAGGNHAGPGGGSAEYADPFDVMGNSGFMRHMSTARKAQLGWYQPGDLQEITTSGTHTATIYPIEEPSASPKGVKISAGSTQFYYLEYRHPFGQYFDNFSTTEPVVNGVSIRLANDTNLLSSAWTTTLIDAVPATSSFSDAPFQVGQTFTDVARGVQVTTTRVTPDRSSAEVSITLTCARSNPLVTASPSTNYARPGDTEQYRLTITNKDTVACGSSTFAVDPINLPVGWTQVPASTTVTLLPQQSAAVDITVTSTPNATGVVPISGRATNQAATSFQGSTTIVYKIDSTAPSVTITSPTDGAVFSKSSTVSITATTSDNYVIDSREIFIDGASLKQCGSTGSCTYDWSLSNVSAGTHRIRYTATDGAGNVGENSITVTVVTSGGGGSGGGLRRLPE
ncbi:MAG: hypothetical protein HYY50_02245 [Candidatus Kerfeldbacteria bacterium]|nr:hypothetical protein [Candidatus Kerfeldbacteria bacterium]